MNGFQVIDFNTAKEFILPRHYAGRIPSINYSFGWYENNKLKAVCTFGKPASPTVCNCVCGVEYANSVYELNRLCREEDMQTPISKFVAKCLKYLKQWDLIIISYSDTAMNHHGYIYQATNFIYTGCTDERYDYIETPNTYRRHSKALRDDGTGLKSIRSPKHRYIYFCTKNKYKLKEWKSHFKLPICDYPKGDNSNYTLGTVAPLQVIDNDEILEIQRDKPIKHNLRKLF